MVETPILYITFARPEYASKSFAAIKAAKPKKLYFYSNKARDEKPDEVARNLEVRSYINQIDWDCEVETWFRGEYVDVFTSIWGAIDWVFSKEEKAIIIEEDVVASPAFFDYVEKLIDKYKDDDKVWIISGDNGWPEYNPSGLSYFATRFPDIYGWASWRRIWEKLDRRMEDWPKFKKSQKYHDYYENWIQRRVMKFYFDQVYKSLPSYNPWDFIFTYSMIKNGGYCLMPSVNLVKDIGVIGANHGQKLLSPFYNLGTDRDFFEIVESPNCIMPTNYDNKYFVHNKLFGVVRRKIRKFFHL